MSLTSVPPIYSANNSGVESFNFSVPGVAALAKDLIFCVIQWRNGRELSNVLWGTEEMILCNTPVDQGQFFTALYRLEVVAGGTNTITGDFTNNAYYNAIVEVSRPSTGEVLSYLDAEDVPELSYSSGTYVAPSLNLPSVPANSRIFSILCGLAWDKDFGDTSAATWTPGSPFASLGTVTNSAYAGVNKLMLAVSTANGSVTSGWAASGTNKPQYQQLMFYVTTTASATVDTLDDPIQIGQPFSFTTSDLGAITGVSISTDGNDTATTEAIDIDAPAGDGDATVLDWIDGDYMPLIGAVSVAITDGTKTATKNTNIIIPTGYLSVNFENAETTDATYLTTALYNFGHPVDDGDLCSWVDANGVDVGENGSIECDDPMTFSFVIQKFSTGLIEMYQIDIDEKSSGGGGSGGIKLGIQQLIIRRL